MYYKKSTRNRTTIKLFYDFIMWEKNYLIMHVYTYQVFDGAEHCINIFTQNGWYSWYMNHATSPLTSLTFNFIVNGWKVIFLTYSKFFALAVFVNAFFLPIYVLFPTK